MSIPTTPNARFSEFFAASLEEFAASEAPLADVSIERGAELIRADRDGRADTT